MEFSSWWLVCVISSELERGSNGAFRVIIKIEEISSEGAWGWGGGSSWPRLLMLYNRLVVGSGHSTDA